MNTTVQLDTHGFTGFIAELARISGKTFEQVLLHQTAALLKICVRRTPAATVAGIVKRVSRRNNHIEFEDGAVISFWKKAAGQPIMFLDRSNWDARSGTPPRTNIGGRTWHEVEGGSENRRWNRERWARYKAYEGVARTKRIDLKAAKGARGLSKRSWNQIAETLGLDLGVPGYVRGAKPSSGREYRNGTSQRVLEAAAMYIEIANDHPIVVGKLNGAQILQGAIDTRLKAFAHEMRKGVFDDLATRAKRYPGLFTT